MIVPHESDGGGDGTVATQTPPTETLSFVSTPETGPSSPHPYRTKTVTS